MDPHHLRISLETAKKLHAGLFSLSVNEFGSTVQSLSSQTSWIQRALENLSDSPSYGEDDAELNESDTTTASNLICPNSGLEHLNTSFPTALEVNSTKMLTLPSKRMTLNKNHEFLQSFLALHSQITLSDAAIPDVNILWPYAIATIIQNTSTTLITRPGCPYSRSWSWGAGRQPERDAYGGLGIAALLVASRIDTSLQTECLYSPEQNPQIKRSTERATGGRLGATFDKRLSHQDASGDRSYSIC
ncbi:hypothetical protein C8Q78DRAFT_557518 [Trametes maxima]|nr:hypothetical protein C8Q78DRAFT_557518 [Trametes maxima]